MLAITPATNTGLILILATSGISFLAYFIRQLLRHAEVLAVVTTEIKWIPQLQEDVRNVSQQVAEVREEQARVQGQLSARQRTTGPATL